MNPSAIIKQVMLEREMTVKELAEKLGILPQSLSNKLYRGSFTVSEFYKIADILNCDMIIRLRDNEKNLDKIIFL